jgi:hypothetical protein
MIVKGETYDYKNLITACKFCNLGKSQNDDKKNNCPQHAAYTMRADFQRFWLSALA